MLSTHKKEVRRFFYLTALIYLGLIIALTPLLIVAISGIFYLDDYVSGNSIRSLYLFSAICLLVLFMASAFISGGFLTLRSKDNAHLRYLYFMLFFGLLAGVAASCVGMFLLLNLVLMFFN